MILKMPYLMIYVCNLLPTDAMMLKLLGATTMCIKQLE